MAQPQLGECLCDFYLLFSNLCDFFLVCVTLETSPYFHFSQAIKLWRNHYGQHTFVAGCVHRHSTPLHINLSALVIIHVCHGQSQVFCIKMCALIEHWHRLASCHTLQQVCHRLSIIFSAKSLVIMTNLTNVSEQKFHGMKWRHDNKCQPVSRVFKIHRSARCFAPVAICMNN